MSSTQQLLDPSSVNANLIGPSSANQLSSSVGLLCSSGVLPELSDLPLSSFSKSSCIDSASLSGILDSTDPTNPTRAGAFRDDYLLTGVIDSYTAACSRIRYNEIDEESTKLAG